MSDQHEDPAAAASIALFKMRFEPSPDNKMSGARILSFEQGWALSIVGDAGLRHPSMAHHFRRTNGSIFARARCGIEGAAEHMHGQGSFPRCRLCQRSVDRRPPRNA